MWQLSCECLPEHGQQVWYCGPYIGVWAGNYQYQPDAFYCAHQFVSAGGSCDRHDAPYWMPRSDGECIAPSPPVEKEPRLNRHWNMKRDGTHVSHD
jgi:hypothetical protein